MAVRRIVFVSRSRSKALLGIPNAVVCSGLTSCWEELEQHPRSLWVVLDVPLFLNAFARQVSSPRTGDSFGPLLSLGGVDDSRLRTLHHLFEVVFGDSPFSRFLPLEEMIDVLTAPKAEAQDLFIGGVVDLELKLLVLVRGDLRTLAVPMSSFKEVGGVVPAFDDLGFADYGQTIKLGDHESSSEAILYEADLQFRQRLNARRRLEDKGFGPSLRRLRKQLGLRRTEFPGVTEKTVGRIEREESRPREGTLRAIEKALGKSREQIESY